MIRKIFCSLAATMNVWGICSAGEVMDLDVIAYEDFIQNDAHALNTLKTALLEKGIAGIRGVPRFKEALESFIESARAFSSLPEEVKETYAPNHEKGETFLGYERGKEKFQRPDGQWVVDDLKNSYYAFVPNTPENKWPKEMDLQTPFQNLGAIMSTVGEAVMKSIGLLGPATGVTIDGVPRAGRMLYYQKSTTDIGDNPLWCGAHFDHGLFTALIPAFYFANGKQVEEPEEAGLFVKASQEQAFKKVQANDHDVLMFQVGEFGQLATNDRIQATEHRVHKAKGPIERYTMALFFETSTDTLIYSTSKLTQDTRYGADGGSACTYKHWKNETFKRYIHK